ncbi:MAG: metallophosphoesterase family protein [Mizugakiibacter sp.]|uniref:metallophosphoesterase family protein n=1 Tax=Mizugakiibacter sp. TaxID=1972610 RepID=UPI0031C34CDC|nr:metallophosphatase family protein [Xanthomonadaceae bacterium]
MRVLLLSDTHGALDARIAALAADCALAAHAGDVGAASVLDALAERCPRVIAVRGNNDVAAKWLGPAAALHGLDAEARIELPGGVLAVVHGDALAARDRHARLRRVYAGARAVLYGHSHRLCVDDAIAPWVLNAGAAGRARTHGGPSCLLLHAGVRTWRVEAVRFPPA